MIWKTDTILALTLAAEVHISRTIDEVGIRLDWDLKDDKFDLNDIEDKAYWFWRYIEENFEIPPKE